jgi:SAM-dependent methyltransferase
VSEAPPVERPEPLRVPVVDVTTRSSLVAPTPKPPAAAQPAVVIQRTVRVISDVPAPVAASEPAPRLPAFTPPAQRVPSQPLPTPVKKSEAPPPMAAEVHASLSEAIASSLAETPESYAAVEVEPLDPLELAEGFEEHEEAHVVEVEVAVPPPPPPPPPAPPPAPPEARRLSAPSNDNDTTLETDRDDVEITVSEDDDDSDDDTLDDEEVMRPSGEFEELELDEARAAELDHQRSFPPPPPPPRIHIPEPPDLSTLTRTARVQEIRPSKPRSHPWWEVFFDDDYLRTVRPPSNEQIARQCDFLEKRLRLKPGSTLLDVGCGLGLQVVELCTRGYLGVGLDLSLAMLSRASEEAQGRGMRINFLHADMRDMNFEGSFDGLMCCGTSFGYFDDETNKKVLERFLRALKPGGVLLLDVVNRDHVIRAQPNLVWFEGDGCVCMEESEFNFFTSRLHIKRTVILDGGKQTETEYALRLYSLHELGQMLHGAGFRVTEVSGREALPGVFFGQESPQMIICAERRAPTDSTGSYPSMPE